MAKKAEEKKEIPKDAPIAATKNEWEKLSLTEKNWGKFFSEVKKNNYWGKKKEFFAWLEKQKEKKKWLKKYEKPAHRR